MIEYAKILYKIAGKESTNKYRTVERLVSGLVDRTTLEVDDPVRKITKPRQRCQSIAPASGIMQISILRGFEEKPCNEKRRSLVKFLFQKQVYPNNQLLLLQTIKRDRHRQKF